ncbi:dTDP-4-dehydrorhamnose 3,5-epimerase [Patescibacteria group bacterium]|nr:MAG: dTDP-4-dehydrorhamnose 3,5-epimerase [Patescibacteria group bacterium]
MQKIPTEIHGAWIIEPEIHEDHRGLFFESYRRDKFVQLGIPDVFVQDNHSRSCAGVLRGLHFQYPPYEMSKLVRCTRGKLYDVVVDMRASSPTFKKWMGIELSESNHRLLYIPTGCAHGFFAMTECELLYKCGALFHQPSDGGMAYDDPEIGIRWPFHGQKPILSDRDVTQPSFADVTRLVQFGL